MFVNKNDIKKINGELKFVSDALIKGETVWMKDPVDSWVIVQQINLFKSAEDYRVTETEPTE